MPSRSTPILLRAFVTLTALLLALSATQAQLTHKGPAAAIALAKTVAPYDVVSVKQDRSGALFKLRFHDDGFTAIGAPLQGIIEHAYDIKPDRIIGLTGPVALLNFDIAAKVLPSANGAQPNLSDAQIKAMTIPLLADRFHLRAHVETRIAPVYDLVVARSGLKFKLIPTEPAADALDVNIGSSGTETTVTAKSITINYLADLLSDRVGRPVIDKTSLTGHADITLKWSDDIAAEQGDPDTISIFTAIEEQLGLKLQPSKGPVDTLVIDHVEMPTEN